MVRADGWMRSRRGLTRVEALLLRIELPGAAGVRDPVHAEARDTRQVRGPLHRVAEPGVERAEVVGGLDQRLAADVVLDVGPLNEVQEDPPDVVVVLGDELTDLHAGRVLLHVLEVQLRLRRVELGRVGERRSGRELTLAQVAALVDLDLEVRPAGEALQVGLRGRPATRFYL